MILLCYDGSEDAKAAIERAGELFPDQPVTVLTIWQPFLQVMSRQAAGFGMAPGFPDPQALDEASHHRAQELATQGVALAEGAGLKAQPLTSSQQTTTSRAILAQAEEAGATAIVMGSRGLTGMKSLLLGSVSHELIQHADRTVVIVPSAGVAASRAAEIRKLIAPPA
jgi:nucleotide-binding universal stress UspA family protein